MDVPGEDSSDAHGRTDDEIAADVFDFVDDFLGDEEAGNVRPLGHYLARYPRAEAEVAEEYLRLSGRLEPESSGEAEGGDVGRYRLVRKLGSGGQGEVWLARDDSLQRDVALKLLSTLFVTGERRERFRREAESIGRLEHPGLAQVHDADIDGDRPYIAMRLVQGVDLRELLEAPPTAAGVEQPGTQPIRRPTTRAALVGVLRFFERVARALHAAHEADVVHRDVKPGNIMVTPEGLPVLLDFGLARDDRGSPDSLLTREGDVFGTLSYMAPEQLRGETATLDRRADVWSTGVTLFEVLTGERPFSGKSPGELAVSIEGGAAKDPVALNPLLAGDVAVVMGKALEPSVDRRYSTALGFAEDLRRICEYEPIHARPAGPLLRFRRWCRREPAWAATLGVTLVALVGGLSVALVALDEMRSLYNQAKSEILVNHVNSKTSEPPAGRLAVGLAASDLEDSWTVRSALVPLVLDLTLQSYFPLSRPRPYDSVFISDDAFVAVGPDDEVTTFSISERRVLAKARVGGAVRSVAFDAARGAVVVGTLDGRVVALGADSLQSGFDSALDTQPIFDVEIVGAYGAAVLADGDVVSFSAETGEVIARHATADTGGVGTICGVHASSPRVLVASRAFHGAPARSKTALLLELPGLEVAGVLQHDGAVLDVAAASDAPVAATIDALGDVRCIETERACFLVGEDGAERLFHGDLKGASVAVSRDGRRVFAGFDGLAGDGARVASFALTVDRRVAQVSAAWGFGDGLRILDLDVNRDGTRVAASCWDSAVRVFGRGIGRVEAVHRDRNKAIDVAWSPSGDSITSIGIAGSIEVWRDRPSSAAFRIPPAALGSPGRPRWVDAAFAYGGDRLVLVDDQGRAGLFAAPHGHDPAARGPRPGTLVLRLDRGHVGAVPDAAGRGGSVALAASVPRVAWISPRGAVRLVDSATLEVLAEGRVDPAVGSPPQGSAGLRPRPGGRGPTLSADGEVLLWVDREGRLIYWSAEFQDGVRVSEDAFVDAVFGRRRSR